MKGIICIAIFALLSTSGIAQDKVKKSGIRPAEAVVTGGKGGTYFPMGEDLANLIAKPVGVTLDVRESKGSVQNVIEVSETVGVALGIIQSDAYQYFVDLANAGDARTKKLLSSLRVMLPLHNDELHFIVAADSPLKYVHEIKDAKIYMDVVGSGTRLTGLSVYRALFGKDAQSGAQLVEPFIRPNAVGENATVLHRNSAFMSLVDKTSETGKKVDVVLFNAGQPAAALKNLVPGAVKLLEVDPNHVTTKNVTSTYYRIGKIEKTSYTWNKRDVPTFTVQNYLITANFQKPERNGVVSDVATSLCTRFPSLLEKGHPKWKSLAWKPGDGQMPVLGKGWRYAESTIAILQACRTTPTGATSGSGVSRPPTCSETQRAMMLCR